MNNYEIDKIIPENYLAFLSQADYEEVLALAMEYFVQNELQVSQIANGIIYLKTEEEARELQAGLDNLIKLLSKSERKEWKVQIEQHFARLTKFKEQEKAYNFFFKDFEYAQQYLRLLVKNVDAIPPALKLDLIKRVDFPGTITILVFDFDEQFRFLTREDVKEWEVSDYELFEIAQAHINQEKIEVQELVWKGGYPIYAFFNGDFAVSYLLDIEQNANFCIGKYGTMLAIPAKSIGFAHPIRDKSVMGVIEAIYPLIENMYEQEPGGINAQYYWYFQGKIETFITKSSSEGMITIEAPHKLQRLWESFV